MNSNIQLHTSLVHEVTFRINFWPNELIIDWNILVRMNKPVKMKMNFPSKANFPLII